MSGKTSAPRGWVSKDIKIEGKVVLITGANTGIGFETAKDLSSRGAKVLMACRNMERCQGAIAKIKESVPYAQLIPVELDLASLESVRACAKTVNETEERLDILINNAGIMFCPRWLTKENFEMQLGVNHIGHFLLTYLLLDLIKKSSPSRIVIVASDGHYAGKMKWDDIMTEKDYKPFPVYFQSKLANVLFMRELSRQLEGTNVTCNSLHPGLVKTELGRHMFDTSTIFGKIKYGLAIPFVKMLFKTPHHGAQTSIYCAIAPELCEVTGKYFSDCKVKEESEAAKSDEDAKRLWKLSLTWTGLTSD